MNRNRHDPELIDEHGDIYKCTKCGKTGIFRDFYDDCPSEDTTEPKEGPDEGKLLRGIINTELNEML